MDEESDNEIRCREGVQQTNDKTDWNSNWPVDNCHKQSTNAKILKWPNDIGHKYLHYFNPR